MDPTAHQLLTYTIYSHLPSPTHRLTPEAWLDNHSPYVENVAYLDNLQEAYRVALSIRLYWKTDSVIVPEGRVR